MANDMTTDWQGIIPGSLKLPNAKTFEPSGLTLYSDSTDPWIFVVGDSGQLIKAKINHSRAGDPESTSWHGPDTIAASAVPVSPNSDDVHPNDFECVSFAGGNIMIGIEGDRPSSTPPSPTVPKIARFNQILTSSSAQVGTFTGSSWDLNDLLPSDAKTNSGMEALTFIPKGQYPSSWSNGGHYNGVFVAATQASVSQAHVYDLAQGLGGGDNQQDIASNSVSVNSNGLTGGVLTIPTPGAAVDDRTTPLISELYFDTSRGYLWVLYDTKEGLPDYLQALSLDSSTGTLTEVWSDIAPWVGLEGMAVDGNDLYLAIDNNDSSDGVYVLSGFVSKVLS